MTQEILQNIYFLRNPNSPNFTIAQSFLGNLKPPSIFNLAEIYFTQNEIPVKMIALDRIISFLKYQNLEQYRNILGGYNNDPQFSMKLRDIAKNAIQQENLAIRNLASQLYSLIIGIEKEKMLDTIKDFVGFINNPNVPQYIIASFIEVFMDVLNLGNFNVDLKKIFSSHYFSVFISCQEIFSSNQAHIELRRTASNFIISVIKIFLEILVKPEIESTLEIIKNLLKAIVNLLKMGDLKLTQNSYDIMLLILEKFYGYSEYFMEIVFDNVMNSLLCFENNLDILKSSITFWCKFAEIETFCADKTGKSKFHCNQVFPQLFKYLRKILVLNCAAIISYDLPISDFVNNDTIISEFYDLILETISKFVQASPFVVFNTVSKLIDDTMQETNGDDYEKIFFILILLLTITEPSMNKEEFAPYLYQYLATLILNTAKNNFPPLIRVISLLLISKIFRLFPEVVVDSNIQSRCSHRVPHIPIKGQLEIILELVDVTNICYPTENGQPSNIDMQIKYLYANLINSLSHLWDEKVFFSFLHSKETFICFKKKLDDLFAYGVVTKNYSIVRASSDAISIFIQKSFNKDTTYVFLKKWYDSNLNSFEDTIRDIPDIEYRCIVQSEKCSIISTFAQIINSSFCTTNPEEEDTINGRILTRRAYEIMRKLISLKNSTFDQAAIALHYIIINNNGIVDINDSKLITDICIDQFHSDHAIVVKSSCFLFSTLCKTCFNYIKPGIPNALDQLLQMVEEKCIISGPTDVEKYLFTAIGSILESPTIVSKLDFDTTFLENAPIEYSGRIIFDIQTLLQRPIYYNNNNYELYNNVYIGICNAFKGYCVAYMFAVKGKNENDFVHSDLNKFGNDFYKREAQQLRLLSTIASKILEMDMSDKPIFDDTIKSFLSLAEIMIARCSMRNNTKLANKNISKLLNLGKSKSSQIKDRALKCLKSISLY
ncbi:hypothetical protein M9Y10_041082 [Tritrichomonas musculus]|uniref:Importin N-terminal domain-containing protein n=1 Tax=Tritrichomonas musculus TaxID=1915356 RepID=A0ABR2K566_9EUKA